MKKSFLIFIPLLALLLTACPEGDTLGIEKKFHGLKGAPVSLREYQTSIDDEAGNAVVYTFDKNGNTLEAVSYDPLGRVNFISSRQYDKHGPIIRGARSPYGDEVIIDSMVERRPGYELWKRKRSIGGPIMIEFTSSKRLRTMKVLHDNGDAYETYEYHLDDSENIVESKTMREDEILSWTRSEYDASGNEIRTYDLKDTLVPVKTYTYDSFDHTGNWTKRTTFEEGAPTMTTVREIIYEQPSADGVE